jgi:hypothetical protein
MIASLPRASEIMIKAGKKNSRPYRICRARDLIGVLHHLPGDAAKQATRSLAIRLKSGAPLILAGNRYAYASRPLLLAAWGERWRMHGATEDEVKAKLGKILQGADPPHSEAAVAALLAHAGSALRCSSSPASSGAPGSRGGLRSGTPPGTPPRPARSVRGAGRCGRGAFIIAMVILGV